MGKVSIVLRGWRFDESTVFDDDGNVRPLGEMDEETRLRLVRLTILRDEPCDACAIENETPADCEVPTAVYGEPFGEVLVCDAHERDFYYWFQEAGGTRYRGREDMDDAFYDWFEAGGRAPASFEGPEHVETDPDGAPTPRPPDVSTLDFSLPPEEQASIDLTEYADE